MFKHLPSSFAWMAAIFAAMGTLFFVLGAHTFYRNCQFAGDVVRLSGTVTDLHVTVSHSRRGGTSHTYHLSYHFYDTGGHGFISSDTVTSDTYSRLDQGGPVPIKYLPHFPAINRVDLPAEDRSHEITAWAFMSLGGLFGGLGWYALIRLEKLVFYRRWLRKNGVRCAGTVDSIEIDTSISVNKRNIRYLAYSYADSMGGRHQDSSQALTLQQENEWNAGDPIDVFCDPRNFNRSTVKLDR